jgi:hypothetical protein
MGKNTAKGNHEHDASRTIVGNILAETEGELGSEEKARNKRPAASHNAAGTSSQLVKRRPLRISLQHTFLCQAGVCSYIGSTIRM